MGLLDRLTSAVNGAVETNQARGVLKELRLIREALQVGVDSYRLVNGMPTLYGVPWTPDEQAEKSREIGEGLTAGSIIRPGDYTTVWLIEELAKQFRVPITHETDLEALALERGWISPEGALLVIPEAAIGLEVEGEVFRRG